MAAVPNTSALATEPDESAMESLPSNEAPKTPFRYLDLPYDIRKIVMDQCLIKQPPLHPILPKGYEFHFQDFSHVPGGLSQVNKRLRTEVQNELAASNPASPAISITCPLTHGLLTVDILRMFAQAITIQQRDNNKLALLVPITMLKSLISRKFVSVAHLRPIEQQNLAKEVIRSEPLEAFIRSSMLQWSRGQTIHIRAVSNVPLDMVMKRGLDYILIKQFALLLEKVCGELPGVPRIFLTVTAPNDVYGGGGGDEGSKLDDLFRGRLTLGWDVTNEVDRRLCPSIGGLPR